MIKTPKTVKKREKLKKIVEEVKREEKPRQKKKKQQPGPSLGRRALTGVGETLGSLVGAGSVGKSVGSWVADIFGMGAYHVKNNAIALSPDDVPKFQGAHNGDTIISHSEMIMDIQGATTVFTNRPFLINPADPFTFPWLSAIAQTMNSMSFLDWFLHINPHVVMQFQVRITHSVL